MKKCMVRTMSLLMALLLAVTAFIPMKAYAASPSVTYRAHCQNYGWMGWVSNGTTAGTTGQSLRMEALQISLSGVSGSIYYRTHVSDIGWQGYVSNGAVAGTTGQSRRVEAVQIYLSGSVANSYSVEYRVHMEGIGWGSWVRDNAVAGTTGQSRRVEAIEIRLVTKSGSSGNSGSSYDAKVQAFLADNRWKVGTSWGSGQTTKLSSHTSWGCCAYVWDFAQYVYGKSVTSGTKFSSASAIRSGDILYVTPQHWMIVLYRSGNTLDVLHGNWTNGKVCRGSYTLSGSRIGSSGKTFSYGYHFL